MGLDLDEIIFGRVAKFLKRNRKSAEEKLEHRVALQEIKSRLTLVARAITGKPIEIYPAQSEGGYKNNNYFLPSALSLFTTVEGNIGFYLYRVLYLSVQQNLSINLQKAEEDEHVAREKAVDAAAEILVALFAEYPSLRRIYEEAKTLLQQQATAKKPADYSLLYGKLMYNAAEEGDAENLKNFDEKTRKKEANVAPETTLKAHAVEEVKNLTVDKKQQEDYVLLHNFEKVETAEEFSGNWRDFDGSDQLEEHQDALEELDMKFTVRVDDSTHSLYQADFVENTTVNESAETDEKGFFLSYDEWDFKQRAYRTDFCKVYPKSQVKLAPDYYKKTLAKNASTLNGLRKMLTTVNNKMQQQRRQTYGDELDIDAITDLYVDVHSKRTPSDKIFISKRKKEKDLSILLLLDLSLSSDGFAANNRVIDVEKEVSILFGEIMNEFAIDFCIDGFYSKTRNYSSYITLKEFDENWNTARHKIGAVQPSGYTRIGAALRHAGARIGQRQTKNKWVILLSDGKPNDFDKYEGKHGISDVKQALRELNAAHINNYALAIEARAKYYLPQMFGHNHYQILTSPQELLSSLVKLYERIKHQ